MEHGGSVSILGQENNDSAAPTIDGAGSSSETQEREVQTNFNSDPNPWPLKLHQLPPSIYIRKPKDLQCCQIASPIQFFTLFLILYYYTFLLAIEDNTFGWKGALSTYGFKLDIYSQTRCKQATQNLIPIKDEKGDFHVEATWNYYPVCELFLIQPSSKFLYTVFIAGVATLLNVLYHKGKYIRNSVEGVINVVGLLIYIPVATCFLFLLVNDYFKVSKELPNEMFKELAANNCRYPDDISLLWATTQAKSHCCGGLTGAEDWKLCGSDRQYHLSCLDTKTYKYQESTTLHYPKENEVWKEGCIIKELRKMRRYSDFLIAMLLIQSICCITILGSFIYAPMGSILPINAIYVVVSGKPKRRAFVTLRGERDKFAFSQTSGNFIVRVKDIKPQYEIQEDVEIHEYPFRRIFHSKYSINICESNMLILQVEVTGHSSFIQVIHTEKKNDNGHEYLEISNS